QVPPRLLRVRRHREQHARSRAEVRRRPPEPDRPLPGPRSMSARRIAAIDSVRGLGVAVDARDRPRARRPPRLHRCPAVTPRNQRDTMRSQSVRRIPSIAAVAALLLVPAAAGCDDAPTPAATADSTPPAPDAGTVATGDGGPAPAADAPYILGSVVIVNENRTTYVQVVHELSGHFDNKTAVEIPGNGNILVQGTSVFAGLTEEPTWVRYGLGADGKLAETGRINFM